MYELQSKDFKPGKKHKNIKNTYRKTLALQTIILLAF